MQYLSEPDRNAFFLCDEGGCRGCVAEAKLPGSGWAVQTIGGMKHSPKHYCEFHRPTLAVYPKDTK
jgi:hypothetical protein